MITNCLFCSGGHIHTGSLIFFRFLGETGGRGMVFCVLLGNSQEQPQKEKQDKYRETKYIVFTDLRKGLELLK